MSKDILDLQKTIKNGMERCLEDRGYSYNKANRKELGRAFLEFYVRDIGTYLYQFDEELLEDGLRCDGSNDLNIDFAYKNEDMFYIIQSKFKAGKGSLERDDISGFFKIHSRVLDKTFFEAQANETVRDILARLTENSQVHYTLLTNVSISQALRDQFEKELGEENMIQIGLPGN